MDEDSDDGADEHSILLGIIIILSIIVVCATGCAKQYVPVHTQCLPDPKMEKVEVRGGILNKKNTEKVLINHVKLWGFIEYLKQRGCK